jgi:hypothetical protein
MSVRLLNVLFSFFFFLCVPTHVMSQISVDASDFPGKGDTVRYSNVPFISNYAQAGVNFVWDYSSLNPTSQTLVNNYSVDDADFLTQALFGSFVIPKYRATYYLPARELPLATLSGFLNLPIDEIYRFYRKTNEEMTVVGLSISALGFGIGKRADSIEIAYKYPMEYGQQYSSEGSVDLDLGALAPFALKQYRTRTSEVDGWGTVKTPFGSFPCLRIHHVITELDSIYIDAGTGPLWIPINLPVIHEYEWWAKDQNGPVLKVITNQFFGIQIVNQVLYRDIFRPELNVSINNYNLSKVSVFPNPTTEYLSVTGLSGNEDIEIYSMSGELLLRTSSHANIDLRDFANGAYLLRIMKDKEPVTILKFIKQ